MKFMMRALFILIFVSTTIQAQTISDDSLSAVSSENEILSFESFLEIVESNHPVSHQAALLREEADAEMLKARGGFEPKLYADVSEKDFNETNYYQLIDAGLKLPTWLGIDLKTGYERTRGDYYNPQNSTPDAGLFYAGISIPVGQGLFIDERRAELRKARIYRESNAAKKQQMINDLLYEAGNAYWKWSKAFEVAKVVEQALELALERAAFVQRSADMGDKPLVDTLEANLQVQTLQIELQQAELDVLNARANLSNYLWFEGVLPMEISETVEPSGIAENMISMSEVFPSKVDSLLSQHPEIVQTNFKIGGLNIDRRLSAEQLKPVLNLNVTPIMEASGAVDDIRLSDNNMKWGVTFEMPLLLRKQRADLQKAKIKLKSTNLELERKMFSLNQKLTIATQEWETTRLQAEQFRTTVQDYQRLLQAEQRKFEVGESSLFLVNSRLNKYLDSRIKLIDLQFKNRKSELKSWYSLGVLGNELNPYTNSLR